MQISLEFQTSDALKALSVQDPQQLVQELEWLGDAGEYAATSKGYTSAIVAKLSHQSPDVVAAAAEALGKVGGVGAYADDVKALLASGSPKVKLAACRAIGKCGSLPLVFADSLSKIISSSSKGEEDIKVAAIEALGLIKAGGETSMLAKLLQDSSAEVVSAACYALGLLGASASADDIAVKLKDSKTRYAAVCALLELGVHKPGIVDCLSDEDVGTRLAAVDALSKKGASSAKEVVAVLKSTSAAARCAACLALGGMGLDGAQYIDNIATVMTSDDAEDSSWMASAMGGGARRPPAAMRKPRVAAIRAIGLIGDESFASKIADYTSDSDWEVRLAAAEALGHLGDGARDMSGILTGCLNDGTYPVRAKAIEALGRLGVEATQFPDMLNDKSQTVRIETLKAIGGMGESGQKYTAEVAALLSDSLNCVKVAAAKTLVELGENCQCYASVIASFLQDEDPILRLAAVEVLPKMGNYGAAFKEDVEALSQDPYPPVQEAASKAFKLELTNN